MKNKNQNFAPEIMPFIFEGQIRWYKITDLDTLGGKQKQEENEDENALRAVDVCG